MRPYHRRSLSKFAGLLVLAAEAVAPQAATADVAFEPTWQSPTYATVRDQVEEWIAVEDVDAAVAGRIRQEWPEAPDVGVGAAELLDRVAASIAAANPQAAELVERCQATYKGPSSPDTAWLAGPDVRPFVRHNMRLYFARWLAQHKLYDEALNQMVGLQPADVIDPAALLFYRMAAHHQLVQPDEARAALAQLLEHEDALPRRYQQVAQLVQRDLTALEDESLDHIARRMRDIRRRLDYGRAGAKVQEIEDGVLKSLDKKIDDLEKQQQQQQQSASASGGSKGSSQPMEDSQPAELKAPMQVDRRDIGHKSGWGDLPPKEREQALQQIGREFPAHYRELIEQYFRELASESPAPDQEK